MKKLLLFAMTIVAFMVLAVSCDKNQETTTQTTQTTQPVQTVTSVEPVVAKGSVGFNATNFEEKTSLSKDRFLELASSMPYGEPVVLDYNVTKIVSAVEINDIKSSPSSTQTLIEYEYSAPSGTATNRILIQGTLDDIAIAGLPLKLNDQKRCCVKNACTIYYGGCIKKLECKDPLPKTECKSCQGVSAGLKQADGVANEKTTNSSNNVVIRDLW